MKAPDLSLAPCFPLSKRVVQGINSSWKFYKGDEAPTAPQEQAEYWEEVNLPHTWNAEDVMSDEPGYYRGIGWYQKELFIPEDWKGKQVYLHFEGASQVAEVFVNGQSAGTHVGAYTAFNFNISNFLYQGNNSIRVEVDSSLNPDIIPVSGDFSVYGGIYRDVYLVVVDQNHFDMGNYAGSGVFISTPHVSAETATVRIKGKVSTKQKVKVLTTICDKDGNKVAESTVSPHEDGCFSTDITNIKSPHLWAPDHPYLYRVVNTLVDAKDGSPFDEVVNPLGFRWYRFGPDRGFSLNGKPLKLIGVNRHQDFKGLGSALPDALHVNDVQWLKEMGGNFLRVAHYPQDPTIMEACDRLGILVSVETPGNNKITESEEFARVTLEMQREMIRQNYNHPCVIIWSYMNEVLLWQVPYRDKKPESERYLKQVRDLALALDTLCREEDPARYTMIAYHGDLDLYKRAGLLDIPQVIGWNLYEGWYRGKLEDFEKFLLKFREEYPDRPMMVSEYGASSDHRLHSLDPIRFDKTQEYANRFHEAYLPIIDKYPFVSGGAMWCLVDYVNESRQETAPHLCTKGLLTTDRKPKDVYYVYKAFWAKYPFVKIGGADWLSRAQCADEGSDTVATQPVTVYSNQATVSLWANGEPLGSKKISNGKAVYSVPFRNGANQLKAISENGAEDLIEVQFHVVANNLKSEENPFISLNVNQGDHRMFIDDLTQEAWIPEQAYKPGGWGYVGGYLYKEGDNDRYGSTRAIMGTRNDPLYQTQRVGLSEFRADVPDGVYAITFYFAELLTTEAHEKLINDLGASLDSGSANQDIGKRSFDVIINDSVFLKDLSSENYLIPLQAYNTKTNISVRHGEGIYIRFIAHGGETVLNAIQIRKTY